MKKEELRLMVVAAINTVQETCGREIVEIIDSTVITDELDGFDSINAVEATAILSNALKERGFDVEVPVDIFLTDGLGRASLAYTVGQISQLLEE
jgi:acyl carrier protein